MLEQFTREYIEAQTMHQVLFTWHGGEPLLRSIDFYRKALALQQEVCSRQAHRQRNSDQRHFADR